MTRRLSTRRAGRHARDHADDTRGAGIDGDQPADGDARSVAVLGRAFVEAHAGAGAGYRYDEAKLVVPHRLHCGKLQQSRPARPPTLAPLCESKGKGGVSTCPRARRTVWDG